MEFKTTKEANKSLKEQKHRLFLDDWIIKVNLVEPSEISGFAGNNQFQTVNKYSVINISKQDEDGMSRMAKVCHEQTLVHELLHCKYNIIERSNEYESKFLDDHQHMLLEQMAKSLIMAKYNIGLEWFINF